MSNTPTHHTNDDTLLDADISQLGGLQPIERFVSESIVYITNTTTVSEAAVQMRSADVSLAVVGQPDHVVGVVSERDIVRAVALGMDLGVAIVEAIETDVLKWATIDASVDDVAEEMLENYLRHVLVGHDDGTLAGVVSMRDLLAVYLV